MESINLNETLEEYLEIGKPEKFLRPTTINIIKESSGLLPTTEAIYY